MMIDQHFVFPTKPYFMSNTLGGLYMYIRVTYTKHE